MGNYELNALGILSMKKTFVNEKIKAGKSNFYLGKSCTALYLQKNRNMIFYKSKSTLL